MINKETISHKTKRSEYLLTCGPYKKVLVYLGVLQIWFEPRNNHKLPPLRCERFNKYNPLTYLIIAVAFIAALCGGLINGVLEWFSQTKEAFTVSKWG